MFDGPAGGIFPEPGPPARRLYHYPKVDAIVGSGDEFRRVLWTGENSQFVIMTVPVNGEIGEEWHDVDQHLIMVQGSCRAVVEGEVKDIKAGDLCIVPAGAVHNFINTGPTPFQLYTFYAPAEHDWKTVHKTREEGEREEAEGHDEPPAWAIQGLIKKKTGSDSE
ncbi:RmlC-like cupin [Calocera viscosa TUFC12733]|uniref:RmlC-like cupin n=1 Tax=Calocera viscosa (strain TUFC12733) TaxID=1330018 RepID=A0A167RPH8_CALVF|nr:RmlC-like cupin [Calocera viscosa TUFC12733]